MIAARTPAAARRTSAERARVGAPREAGGVADYNCDFTLRKRDHTEDTPVTSMYDRI